MSAKKEAPAEKINRLLEAAVPSWSARHALIEALAEFVKEDPRTLAEVRTDAEKPKEEPR